MRLSHVTLSCDNLPQCVAFYQALLDKKFYQIDSRFNPIGYEVALGDVSLRLFQASATQSSGTPSPGFLLSFEVDDLAGVLARIKDCYPTGKPLPTPRSDGRTRTLVITDPQGFRVRLSQAIKKR